MLTAESAFDGAGPYLDAFEHEFDGHTIAMPVDGRGDKTYKTGTRKTITCAPSTPSTASSASRFVVPYRFSGFGCAEGT
jgi:hypothetical protein